MALVGNLKDLKLPNLVQLNCMERNTVKLTIEHAGKFGYIYFQDGQITHAEYDPDVGKDAFFRLLMLQEGKFKAENGIQSPLISIKTHWNNLLLECLHHLDDFESSSKSREQQIINMLMNVKGVQNAAVITPEGQIIASTTELKDKGTLYAFTYFEIQEINKKISKVEPKYVNIHEQNVRILLTRFYENIIYLELETKTQVETIIVFIKKVLS